MALTRVGSMHPTAPAEGIAHGGSLAEARRLFPGAPEPFLDLSTGINPHPYPLPPAAPEWLTRLPEPADLAALQSAAAHAYNLADPAMVAAAPGTQILIGLIPRLFPLRSVAVLGPTYAEHAPAWAHAGAHIAHATTLSALAAAEGAVLCNPNNPDGSRIPREPLLALADQMAVHGGLLVVDEAFADLEPDAPSLAGALPHPALIVLRSFGKTYGLPGLRLGFALAAPARASAIRAALGPWPVSGAAIAIGRTALADDAWLAATAQRLAAATSRLDAALTQAGLTLLGGTCLFRLACSDDALAIFTSLGRAGLFVRRFPDHPTWLRFGLPPTKSAWHRLHAALPPERPRGLCPLGTPAKG